ncbi:MAG: glycosyltransferase family 2 protein [Myxococcota bacterium]|nr:glycosyltransferase family 2 protein [Myxococcota bacterium]
MSVKLASIVLNWRTPDMTLDAVRAAVKAMKPLEGGWHLYVVDNDSQDGSEAKLRAAIAGEQARGTWGYDHVEVIQSGRNGGFGAGNNVGIRAALARADRPEYVYILNSDAFPAPDAVAKLVAALDARPELGIAGSYIHGVDGEPHVTAFRFPTIQSEIENGLGLGLVTRLLERWVVPIGIPDGTVEVDWLAGASMMMRVSMLDEIGVFDETFFLYFEETDLCRRAANAGWKTLYVRDSHCAHVGSASTGMKKWTRIPGYWLDSRRHYFTKNHGERYFFAVTALRLLGEATYEARRIVQPKKSAKMPKGFIADLARHTLGRDR